MTKTLPNTIKLKKHFNFIENKKELKNTHNTHTTHTTHTTHHYFCYFLVTYSFTNLTVGCEFFRICRSQIRFLSLRSSWRRGHTCKQRIRHVLGRGIECSRSDDQIQHHSCSRDLFCISRISRRVLRR